MEYVEYVAMDNALEGSRMMLVDCCRLSINWTKSSLEMAPPTFLLPLITLVGLREEGGEEKEGGGKGEGRERKKGSKSNQKMNLL